MKKPRLWILIAVILVTAFVAYIILRPHPGEVAKYKAGLRERGEKISFAELGFPRKPENADGLIRLTNAVNQLPQQNRFVPGLIATRDFVSPGKARVLWRGDQVKMGINKTTNWMSWETFEANLATTTNQLAEIRLGTMQPIRWFMHDPENMSFTVRYPFVPVRIAAQWLGADAIGAIHSGDRSRALQDVEALTQLAWMDKEDPTLVAQMIRAAIASLGLNVTWELLQRPDWTEADLAVLQKDWEHIDLFENFEIGFLGERASGERIFTMIHTNGVRQTLARIHSGFNSPWSASGLGDKAKAFLRTTAWQLNPEEDEMLCFEHYQGMIESSRELRTKAWPEVRFKSTNLLTKMNRKIRSAGELSPYKYLLTGLLRPNDGKCLQIVAHHETFRRLTITAIALKRFQLRQGHFPATLGKLVPEFISAVPIDPMNIQPLRYRLNADGTFVLYSVGEDGKDDGGDPTPTNSKSPPDLWNARDAVWPVAEESSNFQAPENNQTPRVLRSLFLNSAL